ncbi:adenylate/guanylate cyclase domain-containing protein [Colwellia sp. MSW7]|uniref:Adenylate/guanylate cyclase domain-containing protein n=1 Tax=Colwellia maritima TaxID=2912588 RepID=A0ABS9X105_9GAMM|nr:adenylate/guanylate cyclase domain-containing protein [Colwellia maritima]MCI2283876.1 adenylate/guanylate cyclase domain-containing protein [Colwellia maritima]
MFNQYVPPAYIEKLIHSAKGTELKTERREMSVLFADIRNFTTLSEQFTPEELSDFLKEYLTQATGIIFENKGTIDKYVGDMVMAFWNAPLEDADHALNAVVSALNIITLTETLTPIFLAKKWPAIRVGIGISTGDMVVGDMGSNYRKAYTVLGDAVNLGSRIESLTKYYGVDILITNSTYNAILSKGIICRKIDKIRVKGQKAVVDVYEPLGFNHQLDDMTLKVLDMHHDALNKYLAGNWQESQALFIKLKQNTYLSTIIYDIYLARIETMANKQNIKDWDGVYSHESK